jgi:ABC-2 type transport system ATP-binding protein
VADRHDAYTGYEIESEANRDVRRDVATAVVDGGFGLLELRPNRMSLEDIFLQLTTEEQPHDHAAAGEPAAAETPAEAPHE